MYAIVGVLYVYVGVFVHTVLNMCDISVQEQYRREQEKLKKEWERAQLEVEEEERKHNEEVPTHTKLTKM